MLRYGDVVVWGWRRGGEGTWVLALVGGRTCGCVTVRTPTEGRAANLKNRVKPVASMAAMMDARFREAGKRPARRHSAGGCERPRREVGKARNAHALLSVVDTLCSCLTHSCLTYTDFAALEGAAQHGYGVSCDRSGPHQPPPPLKTNLNSFETAGLTMNACKTV